MEIEITPHDDVIVLSVTGSVDSLNAEQLTSAFAQPIADGLKFLFKEEVIPAYADKLLFLAAPARTVTVGVGDGGNEVGMGSVRARVARAGGVFPRIASVVRVKHLVVAGVSNWGAYGIVAELARLAGRPLLHSGEEEQAMVAACVEAGAVDGLTHRPEPTVDGLPLSAHIGMLELLRVLESPRRTGGPSK